MTNTSWGYFLGMFIDFIIIKVDAWIKLYTILLWSSSRRNWRRHLGSFKVLDVRIRNHTDLEQRTILRRVLMWTGSQANGYLYKTNLCFGGSWGKGSSCSCSYVSFRDFMFHFLLPSLIFFVFACINVLLVLFCLLLFWKRFPNKSLTCILPLLTVSRQDRNCTVCTFISQINSSTHCHGPTL